MVHVEYSKTTFIFREINVAGNLSMNQERAVDSNFGVTSVVYMAAPPALTFVSR
jgi:hypothetical protein